jgi:hypothetical protein
VSAAAEAAVSDTPKPPAGIRCPRCNCADWRVSRTMRLPGDRIRRYRVCRNCDKHITTVEATIGNLPRNGGP